MMIAFNSRVHKEGMEREEGEGGVWKNLREEEGNADYWGMVQPSQ